MVWRKFVVLIVVVSCWTMCSVHCEPRFPMPEMVVIPSGSFKMDCVSGRYCEDNEYPVHIVRIASFELSKYEVTFEEYDAFTDATGRERVGDEGWGRGKRSVINVSWPDAGSVLPSPQVLAERGTNPTSVTIGIASFTGPDGAARRC